MSEDNYNLDEAEFRELMAALVDQTIDEADFCRFSKELVNNQSRRAAYIEYSALHADLKSTIDFDVPIVDACIRADAEQLFGSVREEEGQLVAPASLLPFSAGSVRGRSALNWIAITVLGAILFVSGVWLYQSVSEVAGRMRDIGDSPRIQARSLELRERDNALEIGRETVAVVTSAVGVKWTEGASEFKEGSSLSPCLLQFDSGVVRVEFFSGVTMFLEGPAKFDIVDSMNGFVHQGSLRVSVPEHAKGFTIGSNTFNVEDLGTEFGMNVGSDGSSEVHVLDGEVRVREAANKQMAHLADQSGVEDEDASQLLLKGQGIRVSKTGLLDHIETNEKQFVGPRQFFERVIAIQKKKFKSWDQSMDALKADLSVCALFTFPEPGVSPLWDRTLLDSSGQANDGSIVGCKWTGGRFLGKRALVYSSPGDRVRVDVPGTFEGLTLSCWVKLDKFGSFPDCRVALLHPDKTKGTGYLHWTVDPIARGALLHLAVTDQQDGKAVRTHYSSGVDVIKNSDIGRWIQLVTTYDPERKLVTHFVDGMPVRRCTIERVQEIQVGVSNIGNWPYQDWAKGTKFEIRNLNGLIDEFFIASRAMSDEEITTLYEAGCIKH